MSERNQPRSSRRGVDTLDADQPGGPSGPAVSRAARGGSAVAWCGGRVSVGTRNGGLDHGQLGQSVGAAERKVSRRRLVRDSALTAGALALASQIDTKYALAQDEGPIKIGWLGDRTGDFSVVGVQKFNAANLAVKELNDAGGSSRP